MIQYKHSGRSLRHVKQQAVSWKRFPIGELARKRKALREDYMAAESETARLQNDVNIAQKDVNKLKKRV